MTDNYENLPTWGKVLLLILFPILWILAIAYRLALAALVIITMGAPIWIPIAILIALFG